MKNGVWCPVLQWKHPEKEITYISDVKVIIDRRLTYHWVEYPMQLPIVRLVLIYKAKEICLILCKHKVQSKLYNSIVFISKIHCLTNQNLTMGNGIGYPAMCYEDHTL